MPDEKINVLVVDDKPEWWNRFELRSKSSPHSFVCIQTSSTYEQGLARLFEDKQIDIAIVDLHLDQDRSAFEFIDEARRRGRFLPFAIVSQEKKRSALADGDALTLYIQSQATDYIEKEEVKRLSVFQDRIRGLLTDFLLTLQSMLQLHAIEQLQKDEKLYLLNQEMIWLTKLVASYSAKVKIASFDRLCKNLNSLAEKCVAVSHDSIRRSLNPGEADFLQLKSALSDSAPTDDSRLRLEDYVSYGRSAETRRWVRQLEKMCQSSPRSINRIKTTLRHLYGSGTNINNSEIELLTLQLADILARRDEIEGGVDLLYFLSQIYAEGGQPDRVALMDIMIANFLIQNKRTAQALPFLRSATNYSEITNDLGIRTAIRAAFLFNRDSLATASSK